MILSALAYVVERLAEATAVPLLDRHLASRLSTLAPPSGGLTGDGPPTPSGPAPRSRLLSGAAVAVALAGIAVVGWIGINLLGDLTQSRPDPLDRPARTTFELSIAQRGNAEPATETAEALWSGCRSHTQGVPTDVEVVALGGDHVLLVLEPGIGPLATRRMKGCLSDARINLVQADVVAVTSTP